MKKIIISIVALLLAACSAAPEQPGVDVANSLPLPTQQTWVSGTLDATSNGAVIRAVAKDNVASFEFTHNEEFWSMMFTYDVVTDTIVDQNTGKIYPGGTILNVHFHGFDCLVKFENGKAKLLKEP